MRSCAGTGGRGEGKEGRERVTRRPLTLACEKLPAPPPVHGWGRPAAPRTAGKLSENNVHPEGRTGPAPPPRPETGPACAQCRRPRRRSWAGEAAAVGREAAPAPPHTPCHGALPGVRDGPLAGEGSYQPENPEPGLLSPRGSPPTSPGRPPGKTPGARRWVPATPAQCGSQPRDSARFEQHRVRVLTWRKACRESFRRTATAAMATAPWAKGRRWGTAEA